MLFKVIKEIFFACVDFVFPKTANVLALEHTTPEALLTRMHPVKDKLTGVISLFSYSDPLIRSAIWEIKYRGNKKIAALFASVLKDSIMADLEDLLLFSEITKPVLVPIPISDKRRRERGFNQCELLCDAMSLSEQSDFLSYDPTVLYKIKDTQSQTQAETKRQRMENLKNCFAANPEKVRGKTIIVVDDVFTTGSTLKEARATLVASGAKKVFSYTLAH